METIGSGLAVDEQAIVAAQTENHIKNHKCETCGAIFEKIRQIRAHIARAHKNQSHWFYTSEPPNRKEPDWKKRLETRAVNKTLIGPFQCKYCDFRPTISIRGVTAHIGHRHKKGESPFIEGVDFTALGTGVSPTTNKPKRKYTKRQSVGSQVKQALTSGKPTITIDVPLSDDITIRVPLTLGPPVFIERNDDGR